MFIDFSGFVLYYIYRDYFFERDIMKFLSKISILLLSAVIFMSAFVVFAEENTSTTPAWPYLQFSINVSVGNRIEENDQNVFSQKCNDAASAPFFALTRDYPELTMWVTGISYETKYY